MGTKERVEILNKSDNVINDLLKRINDLEFEVERLTELCDKYEEEHSTTFEEWKKTINIINELEKYLIEDNYKNEDVWCITTQEVLNKIKELKGSDKE